MTAMTRIVMLAVLAPGVWAGTPRAAATDSSAAPSIGVSTGPSSVPEAPAASSGSVVAQAAFGGLLQYRLPPGWKLDQDSFFSRPEAVEILAGRRSNVRMELLAGEPSRNEEVAALMRAPWDSAAPEPARRVDSVRVGGVETALWRRDSRLDQYVHEGGEPIYYTDEFCSVPLDGRFLLFVLTAESSGPPGLRDGDEAGWRTLLGSVRLATPGVPKGEGKPR